MSNLFNSVLVPVTRRSKFNLTHDHITSTSFGKIIPFECVDVVPNDKFQFGTELFVRFAPLLAPVMSKVEARIDYFFIPQRILWKDWEQFITRGEDGMTEILPPYILIDQIMDTLQNGFTLQGVTPATVFSGGILTDKTEIGRNLKQNFPQIWYLGNVFMQGGLLDHLGMPVIVQKYDSTGQPVNEWEFPRAGVDFLDLTPVLAYNKLWSDWYRDQNFQDEFKPIDFLETNGTVYGSAQYEELYNICCVKYRAWEKDYFTGALPFVQRGPEMHIPLGTTEAPVSTDVSISGSGTLSTTINTDYIVNALSQDGDQIELKKTSATAGDFYAESDSTKTKISHRHTLSAENVANNLSATAESSMDLSDIDTFTINDLRRYNRIQQWFEDNARAGSRYIEQILSHFGVRVPDYRLDRAEYLGGQTAPLVVSTTFQQSQTTDSSPLGEMAGTAAIAGFAKSRKFRVEEHGWIIATLSLRPRTMYFQGLPKKFTRTSAFDYFWKRFDHLGEQAVRNDEVYAYGDNEFANKEFGYVPRYAEYKYFPNQVTGDMRTSLMFWHLGRHFSDSPLLNESFITLEASQDSNNRIFAVMDSMRENIWVDMRIHVKARRPMSRYSTPLL